MIPRPRRLPVLLCFLLAGAAVQLPAQEENPADADPGPNDVPIGQVVDESNPTPVLETLRELDAYHAHMVRQPPRVWLPPSVPVSNGLWPMGWTGGVDDPSGGAIAQGTRNTWSNMDTLAYVQHVRREHRRNQTECSKCKTAHQ